MQAQTNNPIILSGKDFEVKIEMVEGLIFLHLSLSSLTHTLVKKLRGVLDLILSEAGERGHNIVFMTTTNKSIIKLWNMIKPCHEVEQLGSNNAWLGSWLTFEEGRA